MIDTLINFTAMSAAPAVVLLLLWRGRARRYERALKTCLVLLGTEGGGVRETRDLVEMVLEER